MLAQGSHGFGQTDSMATDFLRLAHKALQFRKKGQSSPSFIDRERKLTQSLNPRLPVGDISLIALRFTSCHNHHRPPLHHHYLAVRHFKEGQGALKARKRLGPGPLAPQPSRQNLPTMPESQGLG